MSLILHAADGTPRQLDVDGWVAPATAQERALLAEVVGPVLDLGCGPGRLVHALAQLGTAALGVDSSPEAVRATHERGAPALCRSAFDRLPGEGRWHTVLLLDGNIGIGGDPVRLLRRVAELLAAGGIALVEVDAPGQPTTMTTARLERDAHRTPWFPWAFVAADAIDAVAADAGLRRTEWHRVDERWIAVLEVAC